MALNDFGPFFRIKSTFNWRSFIPTQSIQKNMCCAVESLVNWHWKGLPAERPLNSALGSCWQLLSPGWFPGLFTPVPSSREPDTATFGLVKGWGSKKQAGPACCPPWGRQSEGRPATPLELRKKTRAKRTIAYNMLYLLSTQMWKKVERNHMDGLSWPTLENIRYELRGQMWIT